MKNNFGIFVVICIVVCVVFGSCAFPILTKDTATFTVTDKERIATGSGDSISHKYLVFTNGETFENTDCAILLKFNSSDLQGEIKRGKVYAAKVYGWRVPFLSMYRNIISIDEQ